MSAAESSTSMELITVRVKTIEDTSYSLEVSKDLTVAAFKQRLKAVSEVSEDRQRLIYRGRVLRDSDTLADCKVEDQHVVHLVVRPIGVTSPSPLSSTSNVTPGSASNDLPEAERRNLNQGGSPAIAANNLFGSLFGASPDNDGLSGTAPGQNTRRVVGGGSGDAGAVGRLAMVNALLGNTNGGSGGGNLGPSLFSSGAMPVSPAREGPAVVDPSSLEHVRQGLLTLQTLLTAHPLVTESGIHSRDARQTEALSSQEREAPTVATSINPTAMTGAAEYTTPSPSFSAAAVEPSALHSEDNDYDEPPSLVPLDNDINSKNQTTSTQSSGLIEQSVSGGGGGGSVKNVVDGDSDDDDALLGDLEGPHLPDASRSSNSSRRDNEIEGLEAQRSRNYHSDDTRSSNANSGTVVGAESVPSAPHYYVGQWVDCCDTVSQWLEATVMAVEHRAPATEPAVIRQRRRAETLRAARRATRALRRARSMRERALGALSEATNRLATAEAARDEAARNGIDGVEAEGAASGADNETSAAIDEDAPTINTQSIAPGSAAASSTSMLDAVRRWPDSEEESSEEEEAEEVPVEVPVASVLVHYNGWPERWDEWVPCSSPRLAPFRTRTPHPRSAPFLSPSPSARVAAARPTGDDDARIVVPEVARMFNESIGPALAALATRCEAHLHAQARSEAAAQARFLAAGHSVDASYAAAAAENRSMAAEDLGQKDETVENENTDMVAGVDSELARRGEVLNVNPAMSHSSMATGLSEAAGPQTRAAAEEERSTATPQPPASGAGASSAADAGDPTAERPSIAPNMPWISSVALEGGRCRAQPVIMPAVATDLRSAAETALSAAEIASEERRKLRAMAAVLAPLLDRFGRLLADLAPHLEVLAQLEDTPGTIAAAEAAARATTSASSAASGGGGNDLLSQLSMPLLSSAQGSFAPALRSSARASSSSSSNNAAAGSDAPSGAASSSDSLRGVLSEEPLSSLARRLTANIPRGRQTPNAQESGRSYRQLISTPPASGAGNIDIHIHAIVAPVRRDPRNNNATPPPVTPSAETEPPLPDLIPPLPSTPQEEDSTSHASTVSAAADTSSSGRQEDGASSSSDERVRAAEERAAAAEARLGALTAHFNELSARQARSEEDRLSNSFAQAMSGRENAMAEQQHDEVGRGHGGGGGRGASTCMARSQDTQLQTVEQATEMDAYGTPPRSPAEAPNEEGDDIDDGSNAAAPPRSPSSFGSLVGMIRRIGSRTRRRAESPNQRRSSLGSGVSFSPRSSGRRGSM